MSIQMMSWVLDHSTTQGAKRLCLLSIANHANAEGEAWPSIERIAKEANCNATVAKRAISELHHAGHITRHINGAEDRRYRADQRPNRYEIHTDPGVIRRLVVERGAQILPPVERPRGARILPPAGDTNDAPRGGHESSPPRGAQIVPPNRQGVTKGSLPGVPQCPTAVSKPSEENLALAALASRSASPDGDAPQGGGEGSEVEQEPKPTPGRQKRQGRKGRLAAAPAVEPSAHERLATLTAGRLTKRAQAVLADYWEWLKARDIPTPSSSEGYAKRLQLVKHLLGRGWTEDEISQGLREFRTLNWDPFEDALRGLRTRRQAAPLAKPTLQQQSMAALAAWAAANGLEDDTGTG